LIRERLSSATQLYYLKKVISVMPKLQATVPKGAPPNALLRVRLPDGTEVNVRIPEGLLEGQEFIFEVDSMGEVTTNSAQNVSNAKSAAKKDSSLNKSNKHAKKKNKKSNNVTTAPSSRVEQAPSFVTFFFNYYNLVYEIVMNTLEGPTNKVQQSSKTTNNEYVGLLDREIVTGVDFCVALCVGIFIGMSIVLGFIGGVLWVTPRDTT